MIVFKLTPNAVKISVVGSSCYNIIIVYPRLVTCQYLDLFGLLLKYSKHCTAGGLRQLFRTMYFLFFILISYYSMRFLIRSKCIIHDFFDILCTAYKYIEKRMMYFLKDVIILMIL